VRPFVSGLVLVDTYRLHTRLSVDGPTLGLADGVATLPGGRLARDA